ncbi:hypothetical protein [Paenirhodobacter sp. CAU 1674]|jgi:hypothetical protein|uniref:hypothetical protein n=1 Tax=Paenirhodobacter sp. CAU 1674 TaxID=3032596 RepID=UPI0023DA917B|nr:hypothetical protein [Paenirhodobacter sp. CAU 1674]MDF2141063.1 hypothetical protein [Paenirhodobacter sp. CAU 1674]
MVRAFNLIFRLRLFGGAPDAVLEARYTALRERQGHRPGRRYVSPFRASQGRTA